MAKHLGCNQGGRARLNSIKLVTVLRRGLKRGVSLDIQKDYFFNSRPSRGFYGDEDQEVGTQNGILESILTST